MDSNVRSMTVDYSRVKDALAAEAQRDVSWPTRTLADLQKAKEYKAVQLADFVLQHLEETVRCIEAEASKH